jgi:ribosomal protein S9
MFQELRPDLSRRTIYLYNRELRLMYEEFDVDDALSLTEKLNLIAIQFKDLKHLFVGSTGQNSNIRLAVYRNLIDFFKEEIDDYDVLDTLVLNERVERTKI